MANVQNSIDSHLDEFRLSLIEDLVIEHSNETCSCNRNLAGQDEMYTRD